VRLPGGCDPPSTARLNDSYLPREEKGAKRQDGPFPGSSSVDDHVGRTAARLDGSPSGQTLTEDRGSRNVGRGEGGRIARS